MDVKTEPGEHHDKENGSKMLREYTEDELRRFRLKELMATSTLLNGWSYGVFFKHLINSAL